MDCRIKGWDLERKGVVRDRVGHWSFRWWRPMEFLMNLGKLFKEKSSVWDPASPEDTGAHELILLLEEAPDSLRPQPGPPKPQVITPAALL